MTILTDDNQMVQFGHEYNSRLPDLMFAQTFFCVQTINFQLKKVYLMADNIGPDL